jgi:hypothetical protein
VRPEEGGLRRQPLTAPLRLRGDFCVVCKVQIVERRDVLAFEHHTRASHTTSRIMLAKMTASKSDSITTR